MNNFLKEIENELSGKNNNKIHLRVQQRTARKRTTTVQGLDTEMIDIKSFLKDVKKRFSCGGSIENNKEYGLVIKLTGDQREIVKNYIIRQQIADYDDIIIHG